jgi:hypothetical protein
LDNGTDDGSIENMVDNAMVSKQHGNPVSYQATLALLSSSVWGNYMNIVVSGVDVRATNTIEGGKCSGYLEYNHKAGADHQLLSGSRRKD